VESRNASKLLDEALNEVVVVTENGRRKKVTKLDAIMKQLVNRAAQGGPSGDSAVAG